MEGSDGARPLSAVPAQSAFGEACGVEVLHVAPDRVVCRMEVTARHANRNGVLHGGAIMALADCAAGTAAFINIPEDRSNTTVEAKTNFLRSVALGDTLTATCVPLHAGRTTIVLQITLTREDGKVAAVTTQTHLVLDLQG